MCKSNRSFILFLCTTITSGQLFSYVSIKETKNQNFYKDLLTEMGRQQSYEGLLIVQHMQPRDATLQTIYSLQKPKIIMTNPQDFYYKGEFNSDIMAVIIMEFKFRWELWQHFVNILAYMRQIRILMIFVDIYNNEKLLSEILQECEKSKTTNVIIHFLNSSLADQPCRYYYYLWPYPKYHFQIINFTTAKEYFPTNWRNMKGKSIITLPDQTIPRSTVYKDSKGQLQITGFAYKLVKTFIEYYNASYKLLYEPKLGEIIHFSTLENMTKYGILDMPMSVAPIDSSRKLLRLSYPIELTKWKIMLPCAKRMDINQVYEELLTAKLFLIVITFALAFSVMHTIIEKLFYNQMFWLNLLMSDKVIPGVLGQSFTFRKSYLISLRLVYILIFVMGLFLSTLITAHLQTLITRPPLHGEINTFEELRESGKKILMDRLDMKYVDDNDYVVYEQMKGTIEYTDNTTMYYHYRGKFNTSYGYTVTSALWSIFATMQTNYAQKIFCSSEDMNIKSLIPFGMALENNSQYKEPMDYLVHKMHAGGLLYAWQLHVFSDLIKLKKITLRDSSKIKTYEDLTEHDLLLVWTILLVGLISSLVIFLAEILIHCSIESFRQKFWKKLNKK
ncbi:uncharacterized protein LOC119600436 [Lucilia sericata]|uniref:uncharacterized protein LOC119600436 n=1 Tax=Lucilia sericata TaxID=13632 RepID=UPI0018A81511|nr:uncharacterized protein LOC119600436 [Lucilia sericata]